MRMNEEQIKAYNKHKKDYEQEYEIEKVIKEVIVIYKNSDKPAQEEIFNAISDGDLDHLKLIIARHRANSESQQPNK